MRHEVTGRLTKCNIRLEQKAVQLSVLRAINEISNFFPLNVFQKEHIVHFQAGLRSWSSSTPAVIYGN